MDQQRGQRDYGISTWQVKKYNDHDARGVKIMAGTKSSGLSGGSRLSPQYPRPKKKAKNIGKESPGQVQSHRRPLKWRKSMRIPVIGATLLVALGLLLALPRHESEAAQNGPALQGTWAGMRWLEGTGDSDEGGVKLAITFKDGHLVAKRSTGAAIGEADYKVTKGGFEAVGTSKGYQGQKYFAIVKIDGDNLTLCLKKDSVPTGYVAGKGSYLMKLQRQK